MSFNTYIHQKMKTCPQHPVAININDFFFTHCIIRAGKGRLRRRSFLNCSYVSLALNIIFMVLYYPIPDLKERDPSITILNIASFSGSFITPPQRGKGRDPRLPILHTASRRPRTPYPKCSWFSGSFITPPQRWGGETLDTHYPYSSLTLRVIHSPPPQTQRRKRKTLVCIS